MKRISRVDLQVSILTTSIVFLSVLCVYVFHYVITYQDAIRSLQDRSASIYHFLEDNLDKDTFREINTIEDQSKPSYCKMKKLLSDIKAITDVRYLYTAKQLADGQLIYLIDGLPVDSHDFRNAGDEIEGEIQGELLNALKGMVQFPTEIKETSWGPIFVCYFPIIENGKVLGVLGIEFDAQHQYNAFRLIRMGTPLIALIACFLASILAVKMFKRISNPLAKDLFNTDYLTNMKNRNAFEVDMSNLQNTRKEDEVAIACIDLNNLKKVNDTLGHDMGDLYIKKAGEVITVSLEAQQVAYRIGGDEYVIIMRKATAENILALLERIAKNLERISKETNIDLSMAIGVAQFDPEREENLYDVYKRADQEMYENKQAYQRDL